MTFSTPRHLSRAAELLIAGLAAGALASCGGGQDSGASPSPTPTPGAPIVYAAIGASDAIGYGSSAPCVPFTACPDGHGYVPVATRELGQDGSTVTLTNLGIPGAVLSPTIQGIGNQYGRSVQGNFLEQEMPFVPRGSTLVSVFAGGNDTNAIGTAVDRGAGGADPNGYIDGQVRTFANDYAALVRGIRQRAPTARIVAMNLPNFAGLPYTARYTSAQKRFMQRISVGFSREGANALTAEGVVVVDLLCDPRSYQSSNYSSDGFHPDDAGYAFMAAELVRAIRTAGYPPPQGDCSFMRLVG